MRLDASLPAGMLLAVLSFAGTALAVEPSRHWSFERQDPDDTPAGTLRQEGNISWRGGVKGDAIVFDGYTTALIEDAASVPSLTGGFTVAGWIAVAAYPWAPVPVVNQSADGLSGFSFDIGARGELTLRAASDGQWFSVNTDDYLLPHRQWVHIAATFAADSGLAIYLDGEPVATASPPRASELSGRNPSERLTQASGLDLVIGAVRQPVRPAGYHRHKGSRPSWISLDGLLDEWSLYDSALPAGEIRRLATMYTPSPAEIAARAMPSGPQGPARFGAYYTTLDYYPQWDALSRVGPHADLLVRFDRSPARVVFWRGTQYSPAWVTGNGLWMADQSVEGYDEDYTWEHMNDKQNRYSHVRVIENNDARVVVHWRYAPVDVNNELMHVGQRSEMGAWIDEYYFFYPDVVGVRQVTWQKGSLPTPVQFQESIPLAHPGQTQGEVVHRRYATVGNLEGETQHLEYVADPGAESKVFPENLTIQMHHFRAEQRPFIAFEPGNVMGYLWDLDERSLERPGSSSHWPVGRIWSDGRTAQARDRATSFLGFPISEPPIHDDSGGRRRMNSLYGMTSGDFEDVLLLARSWARAPAAQVESDGFRLEGYDRSERVYRVTRQSAGDTLRLLISASSQSPLVNVPLIVQGWGERPVSLQIDGAAVNRGPEFRYAYEYELDSVNLAVWIALQSQSPTRITIRAANTGS